MNDLFYIRFLIEQFKRIPTSVGFCLCLQHRDIRIYVRYTLTSFISRSEQDQRAGDTIENAQYELTLRSTLSCAFVSSSEVALVC